MLGYWHDDDKTREAIDDNGWMHTGGPRGVHPPVVVDGLASLLVVVIQYPSITRVAAGAELAGLPRSTVSPVSGSTILISTCG